jgi:hypothetical protein
MNEQILQSKLYSVALKIAVAMGDDLQKISWKWKNKPEAKKDLKEVA